MPVTQPGDVEKKDRDILATSFDELDQLDGRVPAPKKEEPKAPVKPEPPEEETEVEDKPEQPVEQKKAEPEEKVPTAPKELRKAYEEKKKALVLKNNEVDKLKREVEELKKKPAEDPEKQAMVEKLTATEKRLKDAEDEIRFTNYGKSSEFVEKYKKPYEEAWTKAVAELSELTVEQEDGTTRQANVNDLLLLAQMPLGEARKAANTMFGAAADDVMAHRRRIRELSDAQNKALEDAKVNGSKWEEERMARAVQHREMAQKAWTQHNQTLEEKYPNWFGHPEDDPEGNARYDKAREQIDRLMFMQTEKLPPAEAVKFHALVRAKFANHDRLALHNKRLREEVESLKKSLSEYEKSEPPAKVPSSGKASVKKGFMDEVADELAALDK